MPHASGGAKSSYLPLERPPAAKGVPREHRPARAALTY